MSLVAPEVSLAAPALAPLGDFGGQLPMVCPNYASGCIGVSTASTGAGRGALRNERPLLAFAGIWCRWEGRDTQEPRGAAAIDAERRWPRELLRESLDLLQRI